MYNLKNQDGKFICNKIVMAANSFERMKGLMFSSELPNCDGFLITPCNSIHTFFMFYNIDVLFLDKNFKAVKVIYNLSPWKMTWMYVKAYQVLEMKAGTMEKNIKIGDKFEAVCIN